MNPAAPDETLSRGAAEIARASSQKAREVAT